MANTPERLSQTHTEVGVTNLGDSKSNQLAKEGKLQKGVWAPKQVLGAIGAWQIDYPGKLDSVLEGRVTVGQQQLDRDGKRESKPSICNPFSASGQPSSGQPPPATCWSLSAWVHVTELNLKPK